MNINDGEPYEIPQLKSKILVSSLFNSESLDFVLSTYWDSEIYTNDYIFSFQFENDFTAHIEPLISGNVETRLLISRTILFFLPSFSFSILNSKIYNFLLVLANDDNWGIRKIISSCLPEILPYLPSEKHLPLISSFYSMLNDKSLLVQKSALLNLGKFLYNLSIIHERFINFCIYLCRSDLPQAVDFAYYLPALYRKFSQNREKFILMLFDLLENSQSMVRAKSTSTFKFFIKNLSKEYCKILVPIYINLLRDVDIVKIEAIKNLGEFLQCIDEEQKANFLGTFRRIQTYNLNWRVNKNIAKSIISIAKGISVNLWMQELWKVGILLCHQTAEVVRIKAATNLGKLIKEIFGINQNWDQEIKNDVQKMKQEGYKIRISLAFISGICGNIKFFRKIFKKLCNDSVINVRISCAIVCKKFGLNDFAEILRNDSSKEIKSILENEYYKRYNKNFIIVPLKDQEKLEDFEIAYSNDSDSNLFKNQINRIEDFP